MAGSVFGIGSVSAYVLQHARLPTAVVRISTVYTDLVASQPVRPVSGSRAALSPLLWLFMRGF